MFKAALYPEEKQMSLPKTQFWMHQSLNIGKEDYKRIPDITLLKPRRELSRRGRCEFLFPPDIED